MSLSLKKVCQDLGWCTNDATKETCSSVGGDELRLSDLVKSYKKALSGSSGFPKIKVEKPNKLN